MGRNHERPGVPAGRSGGGRLADTVPAALLPAAFCLLLTLPGIPAIYYGDEFATSSTWARGGPDELLRPPMSPHARHGLARPARELLASVQELGTFRQANRWLTSAALDDVSDHGGALSYLVTGDGVSIRVRVNPTARTIRFPVDEERKRLVLGTAAMHPDHIEVPLHSWAVHRTEMSSA